MSAKSTTEVRLDAWASPVIRWAGSKRKLLPTLMDALPKQFGRYIEPFVGSACLFFATHPNTAILGDLNPHVINFYEVLKRHPRQLARRVAALPKTSAEYYRQRACSLTTGGDLERAVRFLYLNRFCFNGVYRENLKREFNVPRGTRTGTVPTEAHLVRCSIALRKTSLVAADFESTLANPKAGDFYYIDPPYAATSRFRGEYGYSSFSSVDHTRLLRTLKAIDKAGAMFLLSYSADKHFMELVGDKWALQSLNVRRDVAANPKNRIVTHEILLSNYSQ